MHQITFELNPFGNIKIFKETLNKISMLTGGDEKDDQEEENFLAHLVIWWSTK
jgi:hypothetical protein